VNDLELWLAMIAGRDQTGYLETRWRKPQGGMGQCFIRSDRRPQTAEMVAQLGQRTDVYVGCAPRTHRHGGLGAIGDVHCVWVDLDGPDAVAAMSRFTPLPTVVIRSGSGPNRHAYWQLSRPLGADHAARACRRLAHHLGGDMASTDAARILRPPGTLNFKSDPATQVDCEHLDVTAYTARDIVGDLADPPAKRSPAAPRVPAARVGARADDPLMGIPSDLYVPALTGREPDNAGYVQCPFHSGGAERTPSLKVWDDPTRGWMCFGSCQTGGTTGGTIIDFAAHLYGLAPRGAGYHQVRERLESELRTRAAA
jgi:hypothetical protein